MRHLLACLLALVSLSAAFPGCLWAEPEDRLAKLAVALAKIENSLPDLANHDVEMADADVALARFDNRLPVLQAALAEANGTVSTPAGSLAEPDLLTSPEVASLKPDDALTKLDIALVGTNDASSKPETASARPDDTLTKFEATLADLHAPSTKPEIALARPETVFGKPEVDDVSFLTRSIVFKEVELANLNLKICPLPDRAYNRRWQTMGLTNNCLTSSGAFLTAFTALRYHRTPRRIPKNVIATGNLQRGLANFITVAECLNEFGLDARVHKRDKRKGLDLGHARAEVLKLKTAIDGLILHRDELIASGTLDDLTRKRLALEGQALKDLRDCELSHFSFIYGQAKANKVNKLLTQSMILCSNLESGILTYIAMYATLTLKHTPSERLDIGSVGGFGDIIGGSINFSVPLITRLCSRMCAHRGWHSIEQELGCRAVLDPAPLREDYSQLAALWNEPGFQGGEAVNIVKELCGMEADMVKERREMYRVSAKYGHIQFISQLISEPGGGSTKIANGIGTLDGNLVIHKPSEARLRVIGGCGVVYGCGNALAAAINAGRLTTGAMVERREARENKTPKQIIQRHITQLKKFDAAVKGVPLDSL